MCNTDYCMIHLYLLLTSYHFIHTVHVHTVHTVHFRAVINIYVLRCIHHYHFSWSTCFNAQLLKLPRIYILCNEKRNCKHMIASLHHLRLLLCKMWLRLEAKAESAKHKPNLRSLNNIRFQNYIQRESD